MRSVNRPTARARDLRRSMSGPEVILRSRLKRLRARGWHIRRQAPFRGYFLDFVCFARRLVIEVDGSQHAEEAQAVHDSVRDRVLAREGFETLRFWAGQVARDLDGVMDTIVLALERRPDFPTPAASPPAPLHKGEGKECA
ncbi:endonuclease domain-containing protein [Phenylobacterium sp.]|uniref:endonuclease domain-containing protein n=1 Tax=Phenylobacterium sp. TaxID=1871053 RepID=UPI002FC8DEDE